MADKPSAQIVSEPCGLGFDQLSQLPDQTVMAHLKAGHDDALAVLFDRYHRLVLSIGYKILRDLGEAEDVMQAVLEITVPLEVPGLTLTVSVNVAEAPAASVGIVHVTTPPPWVRLPQLERTKSVLGGMVSVTVTFVAALAPVTLTVIV